MADEIGTAVSGPYGRAEPLTTLANPGTTIAAYLVSAPAYHPLWTQYLLSVISLAESKGWPPANLKFPGATHEVLVVALNPTAGLVSVEDFTRPDFTLPYLIPHNIVEQFEATDEEMSEVLWLAARAVVHGVLNPETADAPTRIREEWLSAVVRTLAHIRGEEHAP